MSIKKVISMVLLIVAPFIGFYYLMISEPKVLHLFSIENLVGIVAILSGVTGIAMGFSSSRQASLDAVKAYFQQGDEDSYTRARRNILNADKHEDILSDDVSKICNFFHFWGLMNRQRYLPIWVFDGSSGLQIVKLYLKLGKTITEKRKQNKFYAIEFEFLAYRIYKKYKNNFDGLDHEEWKAQFDSFKENSNRSFSNRYEAQKLS